MWRVVKDVNTTIATDKSLKTASSATVTQRRVLRVWVVEDVAELRQVFASFLNTQPGFRCPRQFGSAEELLTTLAEERPPDLVLMDVNLQGQSGLSAIKPALKLAPAIKVVMMTTFSNSGYETQAFRDGASGFMLKTYDPDEIVTLLQEAYRHPGSLTLFPNLVLHEKETVDADGAGERDAGNKFSFGKLWQRLRSTNSRTAN
jgi:two-component system response regulator DesR